MRFHFWKNKSVKAAEESPRRIVTPQESKDEDIKHLLSRRRKWRFTIILAFAIVFLVFAGGFYFLFLKPYNDGMALVKKSEEQVKLNDLDGALKSLAKARLIAPFLKSLHYREGLIYLLRMDYKNAENLFYEEIRSGGYIAGAELALGFLNAVDGILRDTSIHVDIKKKAIEELSNVLDIDIALSAQSTSLGLEDRDSYSAAIEHFSQAKRANQDFALPSSFGIAYVHALRGDKDAGLQSFSLIASGKDKFPILAKFYEGIEPKLGASYQPPETSEQPKSDTTEEYPKMPDIPVGDLPPIPDNLNFQPPPDISMPSSNITPTKSKWKEYREPTVKPFKLSQYQSKTGEMKWIVTLVNIRDRGQTVAREGQRREMPNTHVEVLVVKLSEKEIVLREDDLFTYKWVKNGLSWELSKDKED